MQVVKHVDSSQIIARAVAQLDRGTIHSVQFVFCNADVVVYTSLGQYRVPSAGDTVEQEGRTRKKFLPCCIELRRWLAFVLVCCINLEIDPLTVPRYDLLRRCFLESV